MKSAQKVKILQVVLPLWLVCAMALPLSASAKLLNVPMVWP